MLQNVGETEARLLGTLLVTNQAALTARRSIKVRKRSAYLGHSSCHQLNRTKNAWAAETTYDVYHIPVLHFNYFAMAAVLQATLFMASAFHNPATRRCSRLMPVYHSLLFCTLILTLVKHYDSHE